MSLSQSDLDKIACLARITLETQDLPNYLKDLSNILDLVAQMNVVDTEGVEPMAHPLGLTANLREDKVTETDQRLDFQNLAPEVENGYYLVPKVIE